MIPYQAVPQSYDPPSHLIATDNQRPVSGDYPYYVGTALDFYDPGYRAAHAYSALQAAEPLTPASIAALQNDLTDPLAARLLPAVLSALSAAGLSGADQQAAALLRSWNGQHGPGSAAASLWWTFWGCYLNTVFAPWWQRGKGPGEQGPRRPRRVDRAWRRSMRTWRRGRSATRPTPRSPGRQGTGRHGAGGDHGGVQEGGGAPVDRSLAARPSTWTWGTAAQPVVPVDHRGARPRLRPAPGGRRPVHRGRRRRRPQRVHRPELADDRLAGRQAASPPRASYPGGQSENPASPWYANLVPLWWDGEYLPVPVPGTRRERRPGASMASPATQSGRRACRAAVPPPARRAVPARRGRGAARSARGSVPGGSRSRSASGPA